MRQSRHRIGIAGSGVGAVIRAVEHMHLPGSGRAARIPMERGSGIANLGRQQIIRHTATHGVRSKVNRIGPVRIAIRSQGAVLTQTCHIRCVGGKGRVCVVGP